MYVMERERLGEREIEQLAQMIVGADNSKIIRAGWQAGDPGKTLGIPA